MTTAPEPPAAAPRSCIDVIQAVQAVGDDPASAPSGDLAADLVEEFRCDGVSCETVARCSRGFHLGVAESGSRASHELIEDADALIALLCLLDRMRDEAPTIDVLRPVEKAFGDLGGLGWRYWRALDPAVLAVKDRVAALLATEARRLLGPARAALVAATGAERRAAAFLAGVEDDAFFAGGGRPRTPVDRAVAEFLPAARVETAWASYFRNMNAGGYLSAARKDALEAFGDVASWPGMGTAASALVDAWDAAAGAVLVSRADASWHLVTPGKRLSATSAEVSLYEFKVATVDGADLHVIPPVVYAWLARNHGGDGRLTVLAAGTEAELSALISAAASLADGDASKLQWAVEAATLLLEGAAPQRPPSEPPAV